MKENHIHSNLLQFHIHKASPSNSARCFTSQLSTMSVLSKMGSLYPISFFYSIHNREREQPDE